MPECSTTWMSALNLAGGLGLFLYGVEMLSRGLRELAGARFREALSRGTRNPAAGALVGAVATAALQSSNATSVMAVGFAHAGLLTLRQSVGILLGCGFGGSLMPQLLTLRWTECSALPAVAAGAALVLFARSGGARRAGVVLMGFGMVFLGFSMMKAGASQWHGELAGWFRALSAPTVSGLLLAAAAAAAATAIVQSSGAVIGMIIALAAAPGGPIADVGAAIPLAVGANVGTTVTAVLAAAGASVTARRVAAVHVIFRVASGALTLCMLPAYRRVMEALGGDLARQIADFHSLHNLVDALLFMPAAGALAAVAVRLVPGAETNTAAPMYLEFGRRVPAAEALDQVRREVRRLGEMVRGMIADAVAGLAQRRESLLQSVLRREEAADALHRTVAEFLLLRVREDAGAAPGAGEALQALHHIERVGDHAENLVEIAGTIRERRVTVPPALMEGLRDAAGELDRTAAAILRAWDAGDAAALRGEPAGGAASAGAIEALAQACARMQRAGECPAIAAALLEDAASNLGSTLTHWRKAAAAFFG